MISVVVADDHPLTLGGTVQFVQSMGYEVKASCSHGISALNAIQLHHPDVALIDINMPGMDGLDLLETLHQKKSRTRVILLTMHNEFDIYVKAKELGVCGYVLKEEANIELQPCIEAVLRNEHWVTSNLVNQHTGYHQSKTTGLTIVENKIVELIRDQKSSKQIAHLLFISEKTVEKHRSRIIEKLNLPKEKNALLRWAMQNSEAK
ncbi:MAG: response regulator transcription factor [Bacteroidota bacterium]